MYFKKFATVAALATLAVATPTPVPQTQQCSTGSLSCCDSTSSTSDPITSLLLGLLGIVVQGINVPIGITCSPITVVGVSGTNCASQTVCCANIESTSLIGVNCTPLNVGL